jgi:hypothetical protein
MALAIQAAPLLPVAPAGSARRPSRSSSRSRSSISSSNSSRSNSSSSSNHSSRSNSSSSSNHSSRSNSSSSNSSFAEEINRIGIMTEVEYEEEYDRKEIARKRKFEKEKPLYIALAKIEQKKTETLQKQTRPARLAKVLKIPASHKSKVVLPDYKLPVDQWAKVQYICKVCNKSFNSEQVRRNHFTQKHSEKSAPQTSKCEVCGAKTLTKHMARHLNSDKCKRSTNKKDTRWQNAKTTKLYKLDVKKRDVKKREKEERRGIRNLKK